MSRRTMLVIDDEPAIGTLIQRVGETCGFDVSVSDNYGQFKQIYERQSPQVIGLDLGMPHVDGIEILRLLGGLKCQALILIISGFDRRILDTALRLGEALGLKIAGTIAKPIRANTLRNTLLQLELSHD